MDHSPMSLEERRCALEAARAALADLGSVAHQASGPELAGLLSLVDDVAARAGAARVAVTAEALGRGEVADAGASAHSWVREHAPSLRQGGAGHVATVAMALSGAGPSWSAGGAGGPDPDSPLGVVAAGVTGGAVSPGLAAAVMRELDRLEPHLREEAKPTVTRALLELGVQWGPGMMRRLRPRLLAEYGHPGELDDLQERLAAGARLSAPMVESGDLSEYQLLMTPEQAAALEAAIGPLSAPARNGETGERDHRPVGQRRVEALTEVCRRWSAAEAQASGGADGAAGSASAVHVVISLADLQARTGCGEVLGSTATGTLLSPEVLRRLSCEADLQARTGCGEVLGSTATGTLLSPEVLRRLSCEADLIPHVLGTAGEDLDLGRVVRLFTRAQRRRLWRRDRGCTYPGCGAPAAWSRAHHVVHWADGGASDVDNAALLCQRHHTWVHTRRLVAEVRRVPDEQGRYVVWDLSEGSYDRHLGRLRAQRCAHDPPPLTEQRLRTLLDALASTDPDQQCWADAELGAALSEEEWPAEGDLNGIWAPEMVGAGERTG